MKPTVYIHCNGVRKLDDPISYDFSLHLHNYLIEHNPEFHYVRFLPTSTNNTYSNQTSEVLKDTSAVLSLFVKCTAAIRKRQPRTRLMLCSSVLEQQGFSSRLWEYLSFYCVDPMW